MYVDGFERSLIEYLLRKKKSSESFNIMGVSFIYFANSLQTELHVHMF